MASFRNAGPCDCLGAGHVLKAFKSGREGVLMGADQRNARIFGVLFLITFVTSIPALALYQPVLDNPAAYISGGGKDSQIYLGVLLELLLIIANIGTAVVVYPILRRQNEILS